MAQHPTPVAPGDAEAAQRAAIEAAGLTKEIEAIAALHQEKALARAERWEFAVAQGMTHQELARIAGGLHHSRVGRAFEMLERHRQKQAVA